MKKNKKIAAILGSTAAAGVVVIGGALALFSDTAERNTGGIQGNVDIVATELSLSNPDNINPGDNDPDLPDTYKPLPGDPMYEHRDENGDAKVTTTPHDLTFTITNNGNKSIRTRHTLVLCVKDVNDRYLDARRIQLYEVGEDEKTSAGKELATGVTTSFEGDNGKVYIAEDNTEYADEKSIPEGTLIKAIRYRVTPDIFDGVGLQAEIEGDLSTVNSDGKAPASQDYLYKLACDMETPNEYQGARISIEATFEALQFRNTTHNDWKTVSTKTFSATIATSDVSKVPDRSVN